MLNDILKDVADYVEWEIEEGNRTADVSPDVIKSLSGAHPGLLSPQQTGEVSLPPLAAPIMTKSLGKQNQDASGGELASIAGEIALCSDCVLHFERNRTVPGQGNPAPEILFVGEAPGRDEDEQGLAFVGRAGQLLTKMIEAMGFSRDDVFIANINKCRPPGNRKPTREEMDTCLPFLKRQIAVLKPKVIIAMGATAVDGLVPMPEGETISKVRGQWREFEHIPLMPTYHPAYLLRNPAMKRPVWEDLKAVLHHLGRPVPPGKTVKDGS